MIESNNNMPLHFFDFQVSSQETNSIFFNQNTKLTNPSSLFTIFQYFCLKFYLLNDLYLSKLTLLDNYQQSKQMEKECIIDYGLLIFQICLFLLGRILDDISWYDVGVPSEVNVFEGVGVAGMTICAVMQIIRKQKVNDFLKILFFKSQLKFMIPWALIITSCLLFFNIFGCTTVLPDTSYFFVDYTGCCINITQIILTNLNYSLICNTKAHMVEFVAYEIILFGEIIYNGTLLILFVNNLQGHSKDLSILLISIIITNQILIMDLLFRAAFEDKEREQEEQENALKIHERMNSGEKRRIKIIPDPEPASSTLIDFSPTKK